MIRFLPVLFTLLFAFISCTDESFIKIDPEVTWENPADIGVGVLLSDDQLNATADVDGVFTYTPPEGTALPLGDNQELKVEFAPKYPTAFNSVVKTVTINVVDKGSSTANFNTSKEYGTVADRDGNAYRTISIGNQTWMAENLRTTTYRNGDDIRNVQTNSDWVPLTEGGYASYNNTDDKDEIATYGLLYNWYAVSDSRNIAPEGWHVASKADWDELIAEVGGVAIAGQRLKEAGTTHWNAGTAGNNSSGFTALPSGRREFGDGSFLNINFNGFWWSATPNGADFAFYYQMNFDSNSIIPANFLKNYGFAVRCVKD